MPGWPPEEARRFSLPGVTVLRAARHPHKLRTGQLRGNRFRLRLRGLDEHAGDALRRGLAELQAEGMPNRYGAQRFGRDGRNAEQGRELLLGRRRSRGREGRFLISALQAAVFNEVLAARPLPLARLECGDIAVRHVSGGLFEVEEPAREQPRADAFEISPTGPIPGARSQLAGGEPGRRERAALDHWGLAPEVFTKPPRGLKLRGARRALRVRPEDVTLEREDDAWRLGFGLPAGSFATVLVEELADRSGLPCRIGEATRPSDDSLRGVT